MVGRFFTIWATKSVRLSAACLLPPGDSVSRRWAPLMPLQPRQPGPWQSLHKRAQRSHPTPVRRLGTQELKSLARSMTVKTWSQNLTQRGHSPTRRPSVSISRWATQPPPGMKAAPTPTRCKCSGGTFTPRHSKWQNRVFFLSPISLGQVHLLWTWVLIRCKTEIMPSDLPRPSQKSEDVQQRRKC